MDLSEWMAQFEVLSLSASHLSIDINHYPSGSTRQERIDRFCDPDNKECFVFLCTTKAGGLVLKNRTSEIIYFC